MASETAIIEVKQERSVDLSVNLTDRSIQAMAEQREKLKQFVSSQLRDALDGDYATIPGTPRKSLLKPGAEKLANIFQLGSRIVQVDREIDPKAQFAMFTYTVEVFHIPTGKAIAQCQGSANTLEKKQANKDFGFLVNSLGKIAQKRAFVGAIISATGASDFFTQDLDEDGGENKTKTAKAAVPKATKATSQDQSQNAQQLCDQGHSMMVSRYPNRDTGAYDWYCSTCKVSKPRSA